MSVAASPSARAAISARARRARLYALFGALLHPRSNLPVIVVPVVLVALLAGCWGLTYALGGAGRVAPHWFYVPVLLAAFRFGYLGAAVVGIGATALSGPLMPADVGSGTAQGTMDWVSRGVFFVAIGQIIALVASRNRAMEANIRRHDEIVRDYRARLEPHERAAKRQSVRAAAIRRVLSGGDLRIVFQPIVDLDTGRVVKVEALSRFPEEPIRPPDVWFAEAWEAGLGVELEKLALAKAIEQRDRLPAAVGLAVNLSPQTIASGSLDDLLADCPCERMVFEITEHAEIADYDAFAQPLLALRARGVKLAIDDVGAGFASLRHILLLRPEFVKLDRSLVSEIDADNAKLALAMGIVACCRRLGAKVVAEGLETEQEMQAVQRIGVELGQGYHFARPAPVEELRLDRPGSHWAATP